MRTATIKRKTKETDIEVSVNLDGAGVSMVSTGIGFFDHMLDLLARHSRIDITVKADGDLDEDNGPPRVFDSGEGTGVGQVNGRAPAHALERGVEPRQPVPRFVEMLVRVAERAAVVRRVQVVAETAGRHPQG